MVENNNNMKPDVGSGSVANQGELSKKNHGVVFNKRMNGTVIKEAYGKDDSDVTGSARDERRRDDFGGGIDNLSHSLSGTRANQTGSPGMKASKSDPIT